MYSFDFKITRSLDQMALHSVELPEVTWLSASLVFSKLTSFITLVNSSIELPVGISIDIHEQKIYWRDAKYNTINVMNMDGSNRKSVPNTNSSSVYFTFITSNGDKLYWTDNLKEHIENVNKLTGKNTKSSLKT